MRNNFNFQLHNNAINKFANVIYDVEHMQIEAKCKGWGNNDDIVNKKNRTLQFSRHYQNFVKVLRTCKITLSPCHLVRDYAAVILIKAKKLFSQIVWL